MNNRISIVLAVYNEAGNLKNCLEATDDLADEFVIVDGGSSDDTVKIAESFSARVIQTTNPPIFHINKQKALDEAKNDWILQLDADERLTKGLVDEIKRVVDMNSEEIEIHQHNLKNKELFLRHQKIIEQRDGGVGTPIGEYAAFFIPRLNFFLGSYLRYGGAYPDPAIRLIKKGKAYFPCKSVHEQMVVQGRVGWLENNMLHIDSPTFTRYLQRNFRYVKLIASELRRDSVGKNPVQFINYCIIKPITWFFMTLFRHKGILDGIPGIVFSLFSALRFPRAYMRYLFGLD